MKKSLLNIDNFLSKYYEVIVYSNLTTKEDISSFLTLKFSCEQQNIYIGMGSSPLARKCHEEHNYNSDLPSTFLLDEIVFKSHS